MSTGGLIGAGVGAVIGFFIAGPIGAIYGAGFGFAFGMAVDPMTPDVPSVGAPDQSELVMSGEIGTPIPDLAGTAKITGHLLCYGKERVETVYDNSSGGGGKGGGDEPDPQITGYKYYMSWAVGIVAGKANTLYAIYKNDEDVVWEGELDCPASGGEETVVLTDGGGGALCAQVIIVHMNAEPASAFKTDILAFLAPIIDPYDTSAMFLLVLYAWLDTQPSSSEKDDFESWLLSRDSGGTLMGSATFYFGTADQVANSKVGEIIDDDTLNTPYRHLCWCFFDDCYIGEYNRAPTMKFVVKKIPEYAFSNAHEIQTYDCNPAHGMWYILHDLTGLPESWLHSADFATIASTLWGERRGLSILFSSQQSALTYLESINSHIDSILRYGTDAKFHPKLIRDDYTVGDLPLIDEDVMLEEPTFDRRSWIDTLNEMKVQYSEIINVERVCRDRSMDYTTFTEVDPGNHLSIDSPSLITVSPNLPGNSNTYVYKDMGKGFFSSDFVIKSGMYHTSGTGYYHPRFCMVSNHLGNLPVHDDNGYPFLTASRIGGYAGDRWYVTEFDGVSFNSAWVEKEVSPSSYVTLTRDVSVGDYGRLTLDVYSDADRTVLEGSVYIDLTVKQNLRYLYALNNGDVVATNWRGSMTGLSICN
jgi:hypothetical protein